MSDCFLFSLKHCLYFLFMIGLRVLQRWYQQIVSFGSKCCIYQCVMTVNLHYSIK